MNRRLLTRVGAAVHAFTLLLFEGVATGRSVIGRIRFQASKNVHARPPSFHGGKPKRRNYKDRRVIRASLYSRHCVFAFRIVERAWSGLSWDGLDIRRHTVGALNNSQGSEVSGPWSNTQSGETGGASQWQVMRVSIWRGRIAATIRGMWTIRKFPGLAQEKGVQCRLGLGKGREGVAHGRLMNAWIQLSCEMKTARRNEGQKGCGGKLGTGLRAEVTKADAA